MLIFLEGNECCFKSTVAEKLSQITGFDIVKGSSFEQSKAPNDVLYDNFTRMLTLDDTIIDRYIFSNLVYANLYKDFSIINNTQRIHIENEMIKKKALIVYLHADVDVLKQRMRERGDEYVKEDRLKEINEMYEEVLETTTVPLLRINTEFMSSNDITKYLYNLVWTPWFLEET